MSFRSILSDVRDSIGSFSRRRGAEVRISGVSDNHRGRNRVTAGDFPGEIGGEIPAIYQSRWAGLPPELLRDVIKRLEESESSWPARKHVVACAAVCTAWREMCKEIVSGPEFCGKLTFPVSLKQPGPREGTIQCFIKRDKSKSRYHLFLGLSPTLPAENGKFLLSQSASRALPARNTSSPWNADDISRSSSTYIGKLRSNFLGTKFIMFDTQPPTRHCRPAPSSGRVSRRFYSKVSPKVPSGNYAIAQVTYELNVLGKRGPRRMHCTMNSIPSSALDAGGRVPAAPERILSRSLEDSFRSVSLSKDLGSSRFSEFGGEMEREEEEEGDRKKSGPLVLKNKAPRWHEQLQCWCLNFRGRVTVASVKNFQLIADGQATAAQAGASEHDKIILQFGKVGKDTFTMDNRYPLSAFQAFAICLSSFDTKLACE
uniref:Tubby-like F-box protein n=1 Tax=Lemna aequinoctialis TaxID=89585 RepID=Q9SXI3_LEMAE|nr:tubby-like protein [Lemna aequinoctialis]